MRNRSLIQTSLSKKIKNKKIGGSCNWEVQVIGSLQTWLDWQAQIILLDPCLSLFISCHYLTSFSDRFLLAMVPKDNSQPQIFTVHHLLRKGSNFLVGCQSLGEDVHRSVLGPHIQPWAKHSSYGDGVLCPGHGSLTISEGVHGWEEEAPPHPNHKHRCDQVQGHLVLTYLSSF